MKSRSGSTSSNKILRAETAEQLASAFVKSADIRGVRDRRLLFVGGTALLIHQRNKTPKGKPELPSTSPVMKLVSAMDAREKTIHDWLEENDPGMLIKWKDRVCKTCRGAKKKWATQVLSSDPEILEVLNAGNKSV